MLANAVDLCLRDRLLLACANLNSYGIAARGPLSGDPAELARRLESELADRYPHGTGSYAFWTEDADAALDDQGNLAPGRVMPLIVSNAADARAVRAALEDMGIATDQVDDRTVIVVGDRAEPSARPSQSSF